MTELESVKLALSKLQTEHARTVDELDKAKEEEQAIREALWLGHGHEGIYGDDGEMQCALCQPFDYKRAPIDAVCKAALTALHTQHARLREAVRWRDDAVEPAPDGLYFVVNHAANVTVRDGSALPPPGKYYDAQGNLYDAQDVPCKVPVHRSHWRDCPGAEGGGGQKEDRYARE